MQTESGCSKEVQPLSPGRNQCQLCNKMHTSYCMGLWQQCTPFTIHIISHAFRSAIAERVNFRAGPSEWGATFNPYVTGAIGHLVVAVSLTVPYRHGYSDCTHRQIGCPSSTSLIAYGRSYSVRFYILNNTLDIKKRFWSYYKYSFLDAWWVVTKQVFPSHGSAEHQKFRKKLWNK